MMRRIPQKKQGRLARWGAAMGRAVDAVIGVVDPERGLRRAHMRAQLSNGWRGADTARHARKAWSLTNESPNSINVADMDALREASNELDRNNPISHGACSKAVECIIGPGLRLKSAIDFEAAGIDRAKAQQIERELERYWRLWAGSRFADVSMYGGFHDMVRTMRAETFVEGDVLMVRRLQKRSGPRKRAILGTCFQMVEAGRVCNRNHGPDTATKTGGVNIDKEGAVASYDVRTSHPGDLRTMDKYDWITKKAHDSFGDPVATLLFSRRRVGMYRGVPELAPVIELLKQLGDFTSAEATAAVTTAFFTAFIQTEDGGGLSTANPSLEDEQDVLETDEIAMGAGTFIPLRKGESVTIAKGDRPNGAFDPFVNSVMRQIGQSLQIPYEVLTQHFRSSYSAARAAILEAWRHFRIETAWWAAHVYQLAYDAVITECVDLGYVNLPGFHASPLIRSAYLGAVWTGQATPQIDEVKAVTAAAMRVKHSFSTGAREAAAIADADYEQNLRVRSEEIKQADALGVYDWWATAAEEMLATSGDSEKDDK